MDNNTPSIYTALYWLVQDKQIESKIFFTFLDFFWPKFIKKDNYIFLEEKYSEERYQELLKKKINPEFWINLLTVDSYFENEDDFEEKSIVLAKALVDIWQAKLKLDFPNLEIIVNYVCDTDVGDYGITFYQQMPFI
ncbi:MAG: hypothetical protein P4L16_01645 [Chlamydiales bacterium]|nr:hypothetical protein [Chlamydiales bacterium]